MIGKKAALLVLSAAGITAVACSSIESTSNFGGTEVAESGARPVSHLHSDIWGIYFLGFESCPVITGSYREPGSYHFFRHTVRPGTAAEMVLEESRKQGADAVLDLKTDWDSSWQTFSIFFWLKEAQASGNAVVLDRGGEGELEVEETVAIEKTEE